MSAIIYLHKRVLIGSHDSAGKSARKEGCASLRLTKHIKCHRLSSPLLFLLVSLSSALCSFCLQRSVACFGARVQYRIDRRRSRFFLLLFSIDRSSTHTAASSLHYPKCRPKTLCSVVDGPSKSSTPWSSTISGPRSCSSV